MLVVIDILVPVLRRPQNVQPLVDSIHANTVSQHRVVFVVDPDDKEEIIACRQSESVIIRSPRTEYAPKINLAASLTKAEFVFLGADDLDFHRGWDIHAIRVHDLTDQPVIGTNDLGNPTVMRGKHATHSLVHRSYIAQGTIDEPGKLLHEGYRHNYCDTEFCETAKKRGAFAFAADSHVEHLHPFWHKGADDDIYALGRAGFREDAKLYNTRRKLWR